MKKKIAMLLCAAMVIALAACGKEENTATPTSAPATVTATPTPAKKVSVTATPTATPTPKKEWTLEPTYTPTPSPTFTPEQQAAYEAEIAARSFNKTYALDLSKTQKSSGDAPTVTADGIVAKGEKTQKFIIPLGVNIKKNTEIVVTVTMQFNSAKDTSIRVYGIQGTNDVAKSTQGFIKNPGNTNEFTAQAVITANEDFDTLLVGSSAWGVSLDDISIKRIAIAPNPFVNLATVQGISGDVPTVSNGALLINSGKTQKMAFPLGKTYSAGDVLAVTVNAQFNSADDASFRFYTISGTTDVAQSDQQFIYNPQNKAPSITTVLLTLKGDSDTILLGSSGWGVNVNDITIYSLCVQKAEVLDLSKMFGVDGEAPVYENGSIIAKGGVTGKFAIPAETTDLSNGSKVTAAITFKFNSADDESVRLYPILGTADANCAPAVYYKNPGTSDETTIFVSFTTNKDADTILLGGKSWGVKLNDVEIKRVVLFESPIVEEVVVDTTPKTGDNSLMIMIMLFGMAAVSGVVFFKKREEVR